MSKLTKLVNEFYASKDLSIDQQITLTMEMPTEEATQEWGKLFEFLDEKLGE